jgi:ankyrin repeat protein/serine/threonine protein kinase
MRSQILQPTSVSPLSKERLLAILINENYSELETFIAQYKEVKKYNPSVVDFFNILIKDDKFTAFDVATLKNNVHLMQMLISAGANPNLQFAGGLAPIHLAAVHNKLDALEFLISIEVDLDSKSLSEDKTAIMHAAHKDNDLIIRLLVNAKAKVDLTTKKGVTAVLIATTNNKLKALQALIDAKADLDIAAEDDFAPVHAAAQDNYYKALELLINANANINACTRKLNATPLFLAVNFQHLKSVEVILACTKTDLNSQCTDEQRTAIFQAVSFLNADIFALLLTHHADPYIPAYIGGIECSLRRYAKLKKNQGMTESLTRIITLINTIPKFPTYENGISFVYHSVSESGSEQPRILDFTETTRMSINNSFITNTPGFPLPFHFQRDDVQRLERMMHMFNPSLSSTSSSASSSRTRRQSYCSYGSNSAIVSTHVKSKLLGSGSYGSVSLMESTGYNKENLAVKELPPVKLKYIDLLDDEEINIIVSDNYPAIAREAYINYVIHGVGAVYWDQKPIAYECQFDGNKNFKVLTAYPRCYIAMKHFNGLPLTAFKIINGDAYLEIFIDLLKKIQIFHKKFIHCDIKSNNIILNGKSVSLVDFSLSRPAGQILYVKNLNLARKPPEFNDKVSIKVAANQDIYCTGLVLEEFYSEQLFSKDIATKVKEIISAMQAPDPENRPTIENALENLTALQIAVERKKYLVNICSNYELFLREFAKVPAMNQISFLKEFDLNTIRVLFRYFNELFSLYQKVTMQNKVEFLKLIGQSHLSDLRFTGYTDISLKELPRFLQQVEVVFNKLTSEILISKLFQERFAVTRSYSPALDIYITNSNQEVSIDFTNAALKYIISNYMKNNDMKSCLKVCDSFKNNPRNYKQILLIANEVYREGRAADPRNYFTFFGRYSKNDKVQASLALENSLRSDRPDNNVFDLGALNQGNLGQIAQRLRKCS